MVDTKESSSGGGRYALLGVLLLGGAAALLYFGLQEEPPPPPPPVAKKDAEPAKPPPALAQPTFVVPDEDAGAPEAGPPDAGASKPTRRTPRVPRGRCEGQVPAREAARVVRSHERQVRSCYERRLKVNNVLQGRLVLRLRIGRSGAVESVQVGGTLRDRQVAACVRKTARQWQFPKPKGGCAIVEAPFNLRPKP